MNEAVRTILKDKLAQHGRELIGEAERCENMFEVLPATAKLEKNALIVTLKERIPQRLINMRAAELTASAVRNYAVEISRMSGLREDVARWAVETWAFGLGLQIVEAPTDPAPKPQPVPRPIPEAPPDERKLPSNLKSNETTKLGAGEVVGGLVFAFVACILTTALLEQFGLDMSDRALQGSGIVSLMKWALFGAIYLIWLLLWFSLFAKPSRRNLTPSA